MSVVTLPHPDRELWTDLRIVRFTSAAVPAEQVDDSLRVTCPFCSGQHSHFVPFGRPPATVWRVPECEAGAPSPRAYSIPDAHLAARKAQGKPPSKSASPPVQRRSQVAA